MRAVVTNLIRIAVALLVARAFFLEPIAVQTGSMATQLLGAQAAVECPKCGREIEWGTDLTPLDVAAVVCPRCGAEQTEFAERVALGGDRLLVNQNAYLFRAPRRWEIVAFRDPESANRTLVKRVVGLPGEAISIRDGDLFQGGERIQKSLRDFRAVAIPVGEPNDVIADARFCPWGGETDASQWETHSKGGGLNVLHLPTLSAAEYDWLVYRPALGDALPYNQDRLRVDLPVTDVLITCRARFQGEGRLAIRFPTRADVALGLEPRQGRLELLIGGESRRQVELPPFGNETVGITAAYCDGRVLAELDGEEIDFNLGPGELDRLSNDAAAGAATLGIGVAGLGVELAGLRLERDIHYLPPDDRPPSAAKTYQLGEEEYLMLGDNPARSFDSRSWRTPGIRRNSLLGRPFLVHGASRRGELAGWLFQVPDFERIRYIPPASGE